MPSQATVFSDGANSCFSSGLVDRLKHTLSVSLLLASALLIFSPLLEGGTTHLAVMVIRLSVLALLAVHLWSGVREGALPRSLEGVGPAVLAFLGLAVVSTLFSPYTGQSLQWLLVLFTYAGLLYVLLSMMRAWPHIDILCWILIGLGIVEAGLALMQWSVGSLRPSGTFFNPNFLAGYLAAIGVLLLGLLCEADWKHRRSRLWLGLGSAGWALLVGAMMLTGSRGGMLACLAGTTVVLAIRLGRKAVGVLLIAVVVGLVVPNPLRDRLWVEHTINPLAYTRVGIWQNSVKQVIDHPTGSGLGLYQYLYARYSVPVEGQITRYGKTAQTAHSEYLQMAVELGVLSVPVFFWGVAIVFHRWRRTLGSEIDPVQRGIVLGAGGAITVILVQAAVDSPLHEPALAILLTFLVAVLLRAYRLSVGTETDRRVRLEGRTSRWLWIGVGGMSLAALAVFVLCLGLAWMSFDAGSKALATQRIPEAIARYEVAVRLDPGKALYRSSLAAAYYQLFQRTHDERLVRAALDELREAATLNPIDGRLEGLRAGVYRSLAMSAGGRESAPTGEQWLALAQRASLRAIQLEPYNPFHHLDLGRALAQLGQPEAAEAAVARAVELEPNFLPGREWLVRYYLQSGRRDAAQQQFREIIERQARYAQWTKDAVEESYLKVDVKSLQAAVEKGSK